MTNRQLYFVILSTFLIAIHGCNSGPEKQILHAPICTVTEAEYSVKDTTYRYEINLAYPVIDANTTPDAKRE